MGSDDDEVFAISGPKHMMVRSGIGSPTTMVKLMWDRDEHRRCIAACMVRGTYITESDRIKRRHGTSKALAPPWWESFGFHLRDVREDVLICECDCVFCKNRFKFGANHWSIYGAILHRDPTAQQWRHPSSAAAPSFIVAFRGTMRPRHRGDTFLNLELLVNRQHDCSRFRHARHKVSQLLASVAYYGGGHGAVWLAGHSLGASIALDVGHEMATKGWYLPTFLFNPPQVSVAPLLDKLHVPEFAKRFMYRLGYKLKAKLGAKLITLETKMEELFNQLAPWVPELYVHESDFVCRGFIDYFEQRQNMLDYGSSQDALHGTRISIRDMLMFLHAEDKEEKPAVQPHLLPSARLWKTSIQGHKHGLNQWMEPDWMLNLNSRPYRENESNLAESLRAASRRPRSWHHEPATVLCPASVALRVGPPATSAAPRAGRRAAPRLRGSAPRSPHRLPGPAPCAAASLELPCAASRRRQER